ncbi:hypothetical protein GWK47_007032 [Chionoecetes opilio]|uniref:Uncharacterized protein n=1 Tax=Chionoecetes opilio TaxID=41210 RepID=A0A8J4Y4F8_CHIOP|nr:hypothetical protein GWK47_007032 [Chionoecetes opilio]
MFEPCVPFSIPGAPANLTQTLSKLLASCRNSDVRGSSRVTGEEYTNLFLQCHARLYLHGDTVHAQEALPTLSSALSTLVATNAFTRTSLIQMVVVNLFALCYFSGKITVKTGEEADAKKDEEKLENTKEHDECLKIVEELTVGMLAALLLPVHTIRDPDQLLTYPALPAGKKRHIHTQITYRSIQSLKDNTQLPAIPLDIHPSESSFPCEDRVHLSGMDTTRLF